MGQEKTKNRTQKEHENIMREQHFFKTRKSKRNERERTILEQY